MKAILKNETKKLEITLKNGDWVLSPKSIHNTQYIERAGGDNDDAVGFGWLPNGVIFPIYVCPSYVESMVLTNGRAHQVIMEPEEIFDLDAWHELEIVG